MPDNNGLTQKELILMVLENQKEFDIKLSEIHTRLNQRPTRTEISGWLIAMASLGAIINSLMKGA